MIHWQDKITFDFTNQEIASHFTEDALFFDIETTGFSPGAHVTLPDRLRQQTGGPPDPRSVFRRDTPERIGGSGCFSLIRSIV